MSKKPQKYTHVGMTRRARSLGWSATEFAPTWLRETPKCWIAEDGCKWPKEKKRNYGGGNAERVFAKKPQYGDTRYELDLTTVRLRTRDELRQPLQDAYDLAKRQFQAAHKRIEEAEVDRQTAFEAGTTATAALDRFDKENPIDG